MSQLDNSVFVISRQGNYSVDEISQRLDLQPDKVTESDRSSVWKLICEDKDLPLEEQLESWVSLLSSKRNTLNELKKGGWVIELDCLIQPSEGAAVVSFEPELLERVSHLQANLTIRFWD